MQFNTGNPSLVSLTRLLGGESSASAGALYVLQEVKDAINLGYEELWDRAIDVDPSWGRKEAFIDAVADQILYDLPSDFGGKVISVALEKDGKDLSTDTTAAWTYLDPTEHENKLRVYRTGGIAQPAYFYLEIRDGSDKFGIIAPPSESGTNSISIVYEATYTALSDDSDVPMIPQAHHKVISYLAAKILKEQKEMDTTELRVDLQRLYAQFLERVRGLSPNLDFQMERAGSKAQSFRTTTGFITRT